MKLGAQDRKKLALAGVAAVGALAAVIYMYGQLFPATPATATNPPIPAATPAPATSVSSTQRTAKVVGTTAASLDPTLHMRAMLLTESLSYHGTGRNIFSSSAAAPVSIPRPIRPARPTAVSSVAVAPSGPPQPPPIDLRFFGTAARAGQRIRAFLLRGDDVVLASVGDIVQRRYKVLSITANSVTVQDMTDDRQQMLPLVSN